MARPTKPKDLKPKADETAVEVKDKSSGGGGSGGAFDLKFIITIAAIFIASVLGSVATTYFVAPMVLVPAIMAQINKPAEHGGEGEAKSNEPNQTIGLNLELDEFTVNLKSDPNLNGNQFLRTKMSLSIAVPKEEYCSEGGEAHAEAMPGPLAIEGKILGAAAPFPEAQEKHRLNHYQHPDKTLIASEGGEGGGAYQKCLAAFNQQMGRYVPTIRDLINAALMKRTASVLQSPEGQEQLKDEIKESINQLMEKKYQIIRINFSDFIIQY